MITKQILEVLDCPCTKGISVFGPDERRRWVSPPRLKLLSGLKLGGYQKSLNLSIIPPLEVRHMFSRYLVISIPLVILLLLTGCMKTRSEIKAKNGLLDLSDWDFREKGTIKLNGWWNFYWNQNLEPRDFDSAMEAEKTGLFEMPNNWNGYLTDDHEIGGTGYATFTLDIILKDTQEQLGLRIPNASTAYRLWLDDEILSCNGTVGINRTESIPQYIVHTKEFKPEHRKIRLILNVSNFHHRRGGMWKSIKLGLLSDIEGETLSETIYDLLLLGSFLFIAFYLLIVFFLSQKQTAALGFSIMSFLLSIRVLLLGEILITKIFPSFAWEIALKIEYLTVFACPTLFVYAASKLYPKEISKKFTYPLIGIAILFGSFTLVTPPTIYTRVLIYFLLIVFSSFTYVLYALIKAAIHTRPGGLTIIGSFLFYFLVMLNDVLHYRLPVIFLSRDFAPFSFIITFFSKTTYGDTNIYIIANIISLMLYFVITNFFVLKISIGFFKKINLSDLPKTKINQSFVEKYKISRREREIMHLVVCGYSNKEIGQKLFITEGTVKNHIHSIIEKSGVKNRTEMSFYAKQYHPSLKTD